MDTETRMARLSDLDALSDDLSDLIARVNGLDETVQQLRAVMDIYGARIEYVAALEARIVELERTRPA